MAPAPSSNDPAVLQAAASSAPEKKGEYRHPVSTFVPPIEDPTSPITDPALPVDRNWLKNLILQHSANPFNGKALVVAPMVDQSDYPFRLLCRRYGANCTFTPMIHSRLMVGSSEYRLKFIPRAQHENDRPVIAQLCGHEPDILVEAAKMLEPFVDGIDLNCGCPQAIAKRGLYGAFLLEEENQETLLHCVRHLVRNIKKPVSVKVRLLQEGPEATIELYQKLVNCGIHLLTVHGRTRHQRKFETGAADWDMIKRVVDLFGDKIPIFANGSIASREDVMRCFEHTGVDGVMSSEAILEYPALFLEVETRIGRIQLAQEYMELAKQYPPREGGQGSGVKCLRAHIHRFLHEDLEADLVSRKGVAEAETWEGLWEIVQRIARRQEAENHDTQSESLGWYMRHRVIVTDEHGNQMTALQKVTNQNVNVKKFELSDDAAECFTCLFDGEENYYLEQRQDG
jgi:tRNA-dihydrouridine synthase 1